MNAYREMRKRHQDEFDKFPLGAAFSDEQFKEMFQKWGLDANKKSDLDKVVHLYAGAYIRKADVPAYKEMASRHTKEMNEAIAADETGEGFIYSMFLYELCNHEFGYTGDYEDTLDALGYSWEQIQNDDRLKRGLEKATDEIMRDEGCY
jgi:hypothetical protein